MKIATWKLILPRMDQRIREARLPPLTAEDRQTILAYLEKYGG